MKKPTLFFIFLILSPLGVFSILDNNFGNEGVEILIDEGIKIGDHQSVRNGIVNEIIINEELVIANFEKYSSQLSAVKTGQDKITIIERSAPFSRNRVYESEFFEDSKVVSITEYLEVITDYFYEGYTKHPELPEIPLQVEKISEISIHEMILLEEKLNKDDNFIIVPTEWSQLSIEPKYSASILAQAQFGQNNILENQS